MRYLRGAAPAAAPSNFTQQHLHDSIYLACMQAELASNQEALAQRGAAGGFSQI